MPGYGLELWLETDDDLRHPEASWALALVSAVAYHVPVGIIGRPQLDRFGDTSLEIQLEGLTFDGEWPPQFITPRNRVGVIVGLRHPSRKETVPALGAEVRYCSIKLLTALESQSLFENRVERSDFQGKADLISRLGTHEQ